MARTLDDVATLSGVSRATVSRVINGGPVAETTRRRVMVVLEETGFRPNAAARTLASGRAGVVGVVLHVDPHLLFGDRYFSQLLQGISDVLAERGTGMMLWLGNRSKEETLVRILGMSLSTASSSPPHSVNDHLVDGLVASSLPTVLVGHRSADRTASYVDIDNIAARRHPHLAPREDRSEADRPRDRCPRHVRRPRIASRATGMRCSGPACRPTS